MNRFAVALLALLTLTGPAFAQSAPSARHFKGTYVQPSTVLRGNLSRHIWAPGELSAPIGSARRLPLYASGPSCKPCVDAEMNSLPAVAGKKKVAARPKRKTTTARKKAPHVVAKKNPPMLVAKIDDTVYIKKPRRSARPKKRSSKCQQLTQQVQAYMDQGDNESADRLVKAALSAEPGNVCFRQLAVGVSMCRARNSIACDNYECAARRLRDVLYLQPGHHEARNLLDNVYSAAGLNPQNGQQREQVAQWLAANGRPVGAFVEYREAARLSSTPSALLGLADAALKTNQSGLALSSLRRAVKLDPFNARSWQQIGFLEESQGKVQNAAAAFLEAARLNPADPIAVEKSLQLSQQLSKQLPANVERKLDLARAYLASNQLPQAASLYDQVAQFQPSSPSFQDWLAVESQNTALKQAAVQHIATGQQLAANDVFKFLNEGPQPGETIAIDAATLKLKSSCNCN